MSTAPARLASPVDRFFEFSLLGMLASGYLAVVGSGLLDLPTIVLTGAAIFLRALLVSGIIRYRIPNLAVAGATLAYMAFYPVDYFFLSKDFLPATVHLIFFIAIAKTLTAQTDRDYFLVKAVAFLEILAASVLSSSFNFFLFLALFLLLSVATFMSSEIRRAFRKFPAVCVSAPGTCWRLGVAAATVSTGILNMTAVLFFLLPRTARVALQHLFQDRYHLAGFSNEVNLGEIGEVKRQNIPVFHVKIGLDATGKTAGFLHWRGSALAEFDGHRWFNPSGRGETLHPDSRGRLYLGTFKKRRGLSYSVHLNDAAPAGALFFAGTPQALRIDAPLVVRTPVDSFRVIGGSLTAGLNYQVFSYLDPNSADPEGGVSDPPPPALARVQRESYLRLPVLDPRISTLAQAVTGLKDTPEGKARLLETHLRKAYGYTLDLPRTEPADPLADFLFRRKQGHCEYFASSMTVMLRTLGIPARVVTGFAGGVFNPISGWYVIRSSDAHSWVEAYLPRLGWTTFDPTPPDPNPAQSSLLTSMGFYIDAAELFWQDWVLGYDFDHQLQIAARVERRSRNFGFHSLEDFAVPNVDYRYMVGLACLAPFLFLAWRYGKRLEAWRTSRVRLRKAGRGQTSRSDATILYEQMLRILKSRGIEKPVWLTPAEFVQAVRDPALAQTVAEITTAYNDLRFGGRTEVAPRLISLLEQLETS